jgi:hypothetical protein
MLRRRAIARLLNPLLIQMLRFATILVLLTVAPPPADAAVEVYHSPDQSGVNLESVIVISSDAVQFLYLFIENPGSATSVGTVCLDGDGAELCAFDLAVEGIGGVQFLSFTPAPSPAPVVAYSLSGARLRLNAVEAISGITGPTFVGSLEVNTTGAMGGQIDLVSSEVLSASLAEVAVMPRGIITVPEPAGLLQLVSGILGLIVLGNLGGRSR